MYSRHHFSVRGFSLVEVVVAVGIFAVSIVAVIGLLGPTNKNIANVRDTDDATRVVATIQAKLQEVAQTSTGFEIIGSRTVSSDTGYMQTAAALLAAESGASYNPVTDGLSYVIYASRDGSKVGPYNSTTWSGVDSSGTAFTFDSTEANKQKFFEMVLIRNTDLSRNDSAATADASAGYLAYTIRLRWPAYTPDGQRFTDNSQKSILLFPSAVHR